MNDANERATSDKSGPKTTESSVCFHVRRIYVPPISESSLKLGPEQIEAVAALLPLLMCGEESAVLAFASLGTHHPRLRRELTKISGEEEIHASLLNRLRSSLPTQRDARAPRTTRRFFLRLDDRDIGLHCARIVALDSAVCILLGELRARRGVLAAEPSIAPIIAKIHREEAQHVAVASNIVAELTRRNRAMDAAFECRAGLLELLSPIFFALESLGVDAERMSRRLSTLSPALFA